MNFVHLKATTEYSLNHSINKIPELVNKAAADNMGAVAITDFNGLFGAISFYKKARSKGLKPIIGLDVSIEQEDGNVYQLTLLAKNANGYKKIIDLNSRCYLENQKIDPVTKNNIVAAKEEWLTTLEDVIVLSGGKKGLVGQLILDGKIEEATQSATNMRNFFGEDFYIELQRDGMPNEEQYMDGAVNICSTLGIPPVATHNNYFLEKEDFLAHEARYCIGNKKILFDVKRERIYNKEMNFKTQAEMGELFSDIPQALDNTVAIAKKCNIQLTLDEPKLPVFPTEGGATEARDLEIKSFEGLEARLIDAFPDEDEREANRARYVERLEFELNVIKNMGFPGYFLIVADFINWAKQNDVPVGPGRGSGAGSLVAYALNITDLDPLPYNLLFERFLNPDRVSMPDFDIDFCQSRRLEVYEYVRQKYGVETVSQIGTFGTMAAKSAVRDVGRTLGFPNGFVDNIAKMIFINPANPITLNEFIFGDGESSTGDAKLKEMYENEADVKKLIDIALKIEGVTKQVGTHAAGVVISPTALTDFSPLYAPDMNSPPVTQFDKNDVETAGLVKFDFLGLRNLTIIKEAVDLVNEQKMINGETPFDLRKIQTDDVEVYKNIYANGNTKGIFQFEGKGMTNVLMQAKPTKLEDIIAINALYRPGPMDIIPEWLASKNTNEKYRVYPHEKLKEVLSETYGFMIYQEQVMQCAQIIAGYTLGEADLLRRAMGKKKPEEMAKQRSIFIEGAGKNGVDAQKATELFDLIDKFSGYGFNKSHAAAYSFLSFQTAYLKHYHPEQFFAANLNSHLEGSDVDKIAPLISDARRNNLTILPPDVNHSVYKFNVESDKTLRYGLGGLKGVSENAIKTIVKDREENGPYTDFYNFLERVGKGHVNKRVIEAFVRVGAFDSIEPNRAQLFEGIADGLTYITKFRKKEMENTSVLPDSMFDDDDDAPVVKKKVKKKKETILIRPELKDITPWDELTQLKNEKTAMGYYFSNNPYETYYKKSLGGFEATTPLNVFNKNLSLENEEEEAQAEELSFDYDEDGELIEQVNVEFTEIPDKAFVSGLIEDIKWWKKKNGAFVTIGDGQNSISLMVYEEFLTANKEWFKIDTFISARVKVQNNPDREDLTISAQQIFNFEDTKKLLTNKIFVGSENQPELIQKFSDICNQFIGTVEDKDAVAVLCLPDAKGRKSVKKSEIYVKADPKLYEELIKTFGDTWVKPSFKKDVDNIAFPDLPYKKSNYNGNKPAGKKSTFVN